MYRLYDQMWDSIVFTAVTVRPGTRKELMWWIGRESRHITEQMMGRPCIR